jgi:hypothetical protein
MVWWMIHTEYPFSRHGKLFGVSTVHITKLLRQQGLPWLYSDLNGSMETDPKPSNFYLP